MTRREFAERLLALWNEASDPVDGLLDAPKGFSDWSGATKDVLIDLGLQWDGEDYLIAPEGGEQP